MTGNQVASTMFEIKKSIHMARIISVGDWNEDPECLGFVISIAYAQVAFGD